MSTKYLLMTFAAIGFVSAPPAARAAVYDFSYASSMGVVSGVIAGALQADNNTILLETIVFDPKFKGVAGPALPTLTTVALMSGSTGPTAPQVSLNGSDVNFLACTSIACSDGMFFDSAGITFGFPVFASGASYGSAEELYSPSKWTITAVTTVPEPGTWALMLMGVGALFVAKGFRRDRPGSAAA